MSAVISSISGYGYIAIRAFKSSRTRGLAVACDRCDYQPTGRVNSIRMQRSQTVGNNNNNPVGLYSII